MSEDSLPQPDRTVVSPTERGHRIEAIPGMEVCDFCTATPTVATYPCGRVVITTEAGTHVSDDPWGACQECHTLIEANDRHGLVSRALANLERQHGELDDELREHFHTYFATIFGQFTQARTGPPALRN